MKTRSNPSFLSQTVRVLTLSLLAASPLLIHGRVALAELGPGNGGGISDDQWERMRQAEERKYLDEEPARIRNRIAELDRQTKATYAPLFDKLDRFEETTGVNAFEYKRRTEALFPVAFVGHYQGICALANRAGTYEPLVEQDVAVRDMTLAQESTKDGKVDVVAKFADSALTAALTKAGVSDEKYGRLSSPEGARVFYNYGIFTKGFVGEPEYGWSGLPNIEFTRTLSADDLARFSKGGPSESYKIKIVEKGTEGRIHERPGYAVYDTYSPFQGGEQFYEGGGFLKIHPISVVKAAGDRRVLLTLELQGSSSNTNLNCAFEKVSE